MTSSSTKVNFDAGWDNKGERNRSIGLTEVLTEEKFDFCWIVKDYSSLPANEELESPIFEGGVESRHQWCMVLTPNHKLEEKEYISIFLKLKHVGENVKDDEKISAKFEILLFLNGEKPLKRNTSHSFTQHGITNDWGWNKYKEVPSTIIDDTIKIQCKIWLNNKKIKQRIWKRMPPQSGPSSVEKLRTDFNSLLTSRLHSDLTFLVEGYSIPAHKNILSARSAVFNRMFASEMQEAANSKVEIEDFDKPTVESLLEYIYTGQTDISGDKARSILQIAEKYDIQDLKGECENELADNLTVNNAIMNLQLADKYSASILKSTAMDFVIRNKKAISKTKVFKDLVKSNTVLVAEIFMAELND